MMENKKFKIIVLETTCYDTDIIIEAENRDKAESLIDRNGNYHYRNTYRDRKFIAIETRD